MPVEYDTWTANLPGGHGFAQSPSSFIITPKSPKTQSGGFTFIDSPPHITSVTETNKHLKYNVLSTLT